MPTLKRHVLLVTIFVAFFSLKNYASNGIFETNKEEAKIKHELLYYKSKSNILDKNIILEDFKSMPKSNNFGVSNGEYWFKLKLHKTLNKSNLIAYISTHNIDKIDIYQLVNNQLEYLSSTGNSIRVNEIPINYKFPAFKINAKKSDIFYLKVNFPKEANFPLKIINEKDFTSYISNKQVINSLYYGSAIVIILLNLFFFFKFKDTSYLFYLLFLTSLMINFLLYDGSLINLFRGNEFYYKLELLIHLSNEIWFIFFSIKFLNINKRHPNFIKLFFIFPIVVSTLYIYYLITKSFVIVAIADAIGISLLPILWFFGIYYIKQIPYAKFYVFGYLLLIPFAVYFIIGFPFGFWEVNGEMLIIKIASWLDILVFTYAISYRMKVKVEERDNNVLEIQNPIQTSKVNLPLIDKPKLVDSYFELLRENKFDIQPLTLREIDILESICNGLNNIEISSKLFISSNTVKYHIRNIYKKANVNSKTELIEKLAYNKLLINT